MADKVTQVTSSSSHLLIIKQKKYGSIIFDFKYLKNHELYEHQIESNAALLDADSEFKESHMEILRRFYVLFESIYKYVKDFTQYVQDLEDGVFIQHTLEVSF